jgi:PIN domain nuclease of toxin-antitoxin system
VNLLLDTHIFLWFISGDERLPSPLRQAVTDKSNRVFLSVVSVWEATIKFQIGKLQLPEPPGVYLPVQRARHFISPLSLDEESVGRLGYLPRHHRDPFDRMLICQAIEHGLVIATVDTLVMQYGVATMSVS